MSNSRLSQLEAAIKWLQDEVKVLKAKVWALQEEDRRTHYKAKLLARNGRWGDCVDCPRDDAGMPYPERCAHTDRYDHKLGPQD